MTLTCPPSAFLLACACALQSYANITGVPAVMGLYGAFLPVLIYSLFGSSRQLGVGPVAVTSGLIFSGLNGVVKGYDEITDPNDVSKELAPVMVSGNLRGFGGLQEGAGRVVAGHVRGQHVSSELNGCLANGGRVCWKERAAAAAPLEA